jgi:methylenetetrahydrofolate dehydrogenase (NADP+)/methenyltetrahydrofolate cyclohydrolase
MPAAIIDGKAVSEKLREKAKEKSRALEQKGVRPCLAMLLVGDNPASISYVTAKEKALAQASMQSRDMRLKSDTGEEELLALIDQLNNDTSVHGILVQLPLPGHINEDKVISKINPAKDVDGFHPVSLGNLALGRPGFVPCTPAGIIVLLQEYNISIRGEHAVIIGRSNIVGKPLASLLLRHSATLTICHSATKDLARHTRNADILIAAAGKPGLVTADMIRPGAVVIDVGVNRVEDASKKKGYRLCGDVDAGAAEVAGFITPVPGGVGPMTIAMLLENVIQAAE